MARPKYRIKSKRWDYWYFEVRVFWLFYYRPYYIINNITNRFYTSGYALQWARERVGDLPYIAVYEKDWYGKTFVKMKRWSD